MFREEGWRVSALQHPRNPRSPPRTLPTGSLAEGLDRSQVSALPFTAFELGCQMASDSCLWFRSIAWVLIRVWNGGDGQGCASSAPQLAGASRALAEQSVCPFPGLGASPGSSTALGSGRVTHFGHCPAGTHLFCSSAERVNAILGGLSGSRSHGKGIGSLRLQPVNELRDANRAGVLPFWGSAAGGRGWSSGTGEDPAGACSGAGIRSWREVAGKAGGNCVLSSAIGAGAASQRSSQAGWAVTLRCGRSERGLGHQSKRQGPELSRAGKGRAEITSGHGRSTDPRDWMGWLKWTRTEMEREGVVIQKPGRL